MKHQYGIHLVQFLLTLSFTELQIKFLFFIIMGGIYGLFDIYCAFWDLHICASLTKCVRGGIS